MEKEALIQILAKRKASPYIVKSSGMAAKDVDMTKRIVTGFYNSYNYFDSDCDVLFMGSSAKSISERGPGARAADKAQIKHLLDHQWDSARRPGKIMTLKEATVDNITGIYFETKMLDTTIGNDTLINYQEGIHDQHSIGFIYMDGFLVTEDEKDWDRYLSMLVNPDDARKMGYMFGWKEIMFYEGSTVAFGANSLTPYLGSKSMTKAAKAIKYNERLQLLEKSITSGSQSDDTIQNIQMQFAQLKQMASELFEDGEETDIKSALITSRVEKPTAPAVKQSRFASIGQGK